MAPQTFRRSFVDGSSWKTNDTISMTTTVMDLTVPKATSALVCGPMAEMCVNHTSQLQSWKGPSDSPSVRLSPSRCTSLLTAAVTSSRLLVERTAPSMLSSRAIRAWADSQVLMDRDDYERLAAIFRPRHELTHGESQAHPAKRISTWIARTGSLSIRSRPARPVRKVNAAARRTCRCTSAHVPAQSKDVIDELPDGILMIASNVVDSRRHISFVPNGSQSQWRLHDLSSPLANYTRSFSHRVRPARGGELHPSSALQTRFAAGVDIRKDKDHQLCACATDSSNVAVTAREVVVYEHKGGFPAVAESRTLEGEGQDENLIRSLLRLIAAVLCGASFIVSRVRDRENGSDEYDGSEFSHWLAYMMAFPVELRQCRDPESVDDSSSDSEDASEDGDICNEDFAIVEEAPFRFEALDVDVQDEITDADEVSWEVIDADVEASGDADPDSWQLVEDCDVDHTEA